jgi:hypothetical protein
MLCCKRKGGAMGTVGIALLVVAGVAVVGVAWSLGPDIVRYMKIKSM